MLVRNKKRVQMSAKALMKAPDIFFKLLLPKFLFKVSFKNVTSTCGFYMVYTVQTWHIPFPVIAELKKIGELSDIFRGFSVKQI